MKKIKVLHISETFVTGVYTYIQSICNYTSQNKNIETTIIYSPNREGTTDQNFKGDFADNVKLIPVSMQREVSLKSDYKSYLEIKKIIKTIGPDVIHLHSSKAGVLGRIASNSYPRARVYYTPNGYSFLREDVSKFKQKVFKGIEYGIARIFGGTTIACGETEFEYAKEFGDAVLVRNGIDLQPLQKFEIKANDKLNTIVTLGRISAQKNPDLFNRVATAFPSLKFIWIGDGELRHLLKATNIEVTGWLSRQNALKKLAKYDVYIQTSLWEGLPFTIIEAMALRKPILATNVIGNKDAVSHKKNGLLCDGIDDFITAINTLIKQPELLNQYGRTSAEIAEDLFDRNKNFEKLIKIYLAQDTL